MVINGAEDGKMSGKEDHKLNPLPTLPDMEISRVCPECGGIDSRQYLCDNCEDGRIKRKLQWGDIELKIVELVNLHKVIQADLKTGLKEKGWSICLKGDG